MSKTNSESRNVREPKERELRDDELTLVSGGAENKKAALGGDGGSYARSPAMDAWNTLLSNYGYK